MCLYASIDLIVFNLVSLALIFCLLFNISRVKVASFMSCLRKTRCYKGLNSTKFFAIYTIANYVLYYIPQACFLFRIYSFSSCFVVICRNMALKVFFFPAGFTTYSVYCLPVMLI